MFKRSFLVLFLCSAWVPLLRGQSDLNIKDIDPLFRSWGASTFIDIIRGPATTYEQGGRERAFQTEGFSYLTAAYRARMNLLELFKDVAISTSLTPSAGASFFRSGYMHFNLPALLHLEIGANATKKASIKKFGVVGGVGYEFHAAPLIVDHSGLPGPLKRKKKLQNTWLQPVYTLGIRYKRSGRLMEIGLKYGQGTGTFIKDKKIQAQSIRVMAFYFL